MQFMSHLKSEPTYTISIMKWIVALPAQHYCLVGLMVLSS